MKATILASFHEDVEFKTIDELTLRDSLYPSAPRGAGVIMTSEIKTLLREVAESFQRNGVTALIYDSRSIGLGDGLPRNEIDFMKQVEDYFDALIWLAKHPLVDPSRVAF
ncbi:hypothetical protein FQN54_006166 [Arachnomyces sp. PD_36]|nr:hypothetical protein FQN54_006166 [Arachnomyces sp. PD_36]